MAGILQTNFSNAFSLMENFDISLKFVRNWPIYRKSSLVQVLAQQWTDDKPPEPMMIQITSTAHFEVLVHNR